MWIVEHEKRPYDVCRLVESFSFFFFCVRIIFLLVFVLPILCSAKHFSDVFRFVLLLLRRNAIIRVLTMSVARNRSTRDSVNRYIVEWIVTSTNYCQNCCIIACSETTSSYSSMGLEVVSGPLYRTHLICNVLEGLLAREVGRKRFEFMGFHFLNSSHSSRDCKLNFSNFRMRQIGNWNHLLDISFIRSTLRHTYIISRVS